MALIVNIHLTTIIYMVYSLCSGGVMGKKCQLNFVVEEEMLVKVKDLAWRRRLTVSEFLRELITEESSRVGLLNKEDENVD